MDQGATNTGTAEGIPSLGMGRGKRLAVHGHYEPSLTHQFLRGCACGSPHPIALRSPNPTICPGCGAPAVPPSAPITDRAVVPGLWFQIGSFLMWIGLQLDKLSKRI